MVGGGRPLLPEISGQLAPVGAKSPSCKAFIGLTIHAKMIGEERPLLPGEPKKIPPYDFC